MVKPISNRLPLWKKHTLASERRRKLYTGTFILVVCLSLLLLGVAAYNGGWWTKILDWAVVAIPAIAGLVAWVIPVKRPTPFHRFWLFVAGLILSGLIYLQQWETSITHEREMAKLATKEDIAKLPSAADIVKEFSKSQLTELSRSPGVPPVIPKKESFLGRGKGKTDAEEGGKKDDTANISEGLRELKSLIVGQRWGLSADQLVVLSRRMAPYASIVNTWQGAGEIITAVLGNQDSIRFAFGLVSALRSAGWNLPGSGFTQAIFGGNVVGFIVQIHSQDDANMPVLNPLITTMRESGIQVRGEIADSVPAGQFRIIVGARPE